jgi:hypothetical protein
LRPCPYDARGLAPFPPGVWACPHSRPREPGGRRGPAARGDRRSSGLGRAEAARGRRRPPTNPAHQRRHREGRPDTQVVRAVDRAQRQHGRTPHTHPPVRRQRRLPVAATVQYRLDAGVATADAEARRRGAPRVVPRRVNGPQTPPGTPRASASGRACAGSPHARGDVASRAIPSRSRCAPSPTGHHRPVSSCKWAVGRRSRSARRPS